LAHPQLAPLKAWLEEHVPATARDVSAAA
jgi:hypothetical protein